MRRQTRTVNLETQLSELLVQILDCCLNVLQDVWPVKLCSTRPRRRRFRSVIRTPYRTLVRWDEAVALVGCHQITIPIRKESFLES
jgi:hypothetical protein